MKKLIISLKTPAEVLEDFKKSLNCAMKGERKEPHYEIAFDNKKDFQKFIRNIDVLMAILHLKPHSIYELAKLMDRDQSNINKVILFFESFGVIRIESIKSDSRTLKRPIVDYQKIEFNLAA